MVQLRKVSSEFPMPKVRDSFTRQFSETLTTDTFILEDKNGKNIWLLLKKNLFQQTFQSRKYCPVSHFCVKIYMGLELGKLDS